MPERLLSLCRTCALQPDCAGDELLCARPLLHAGKAVRRSLPAMSCGALAKLKGSTRLHDILRDQQNGHLFTA